MLVEKIYKLARHMENDADMIRFIAYFEGLDDSLPDGQERTKMWEMWDNIIDNMEKEKKERLEKLIEEIDAF